MIKRAKTLSCHVAFFHQVENDIKFQTIFVTTKFEQQNIKASFRDAVTEKWNCSEVLVISSPLKTGA